MVGHPAARSFHILVHYPNVVSNERFRETMPPYTIIGNESALVVSYPQCNYAGGNPSNAGSYK